MANISKRGAQRLRKQLERQERGFQNRPPSASTFPLGTPGYFLHAVTNSAVSAAPSTTQMSSGTASIMDVADDGSLTDSGDDIDFWHKETGGGIGSGKSILLAPSVGGYVAVYEVGSC